MLSLLDFLFVYLRQTVDIVMIAFDAEILCEIDDLHVLWDGVLLEESLAFTMSETEEHYINLVERHLVGELQISIANETLVDIRYQIAGIAF